VTEKVGTLGLRVVRRNCYGDAKKLAKILPKKLQFYIPLPYAFDVKNTTHLIKDLAECPKHVNHC
jgi:hypothetical protein